MLWYRDCHRVDATGIDAFDVVKLCSSLRPLLPLALAHGAMGYYRRRQNSTAQPNAAAGTALLNPSTHRLKAWSGARHPKLHSYLTH